MRNHNPNTIIMIWRVVVFLGLIGKSFADPGPQNVSDIKKVCSFTAEGDISSNEKVKGFCTIDGKKGLLSESFDGGLRLWVELDTAITVKMNGVYECKVWVEGYEPFKYECANSDNINTTDTGSTNPFKLPDHGVLEPSKKTGQMDVYYMGSAPKRPFERSGDGYELLKDYRWKGVIRLKSGKHQKIRIAKGGLAGTFDVLPVHLDREDALVLESCTRKKVTYDLRTLKKLSPQQARALFNLNLNGRQPRVAWSQPKQRDELDASAVRHTGSSITIAWPENYLCGPVKKRPLTLAQQFLEIDLDAPEFPGQALQFSRAGGVDIVVSSQPASVRRKARHTNMRRQLLLKGKPEHLDKLLTVVVRDGLKSQTVSKKKTERFFEFEATALATVDLASLTLTFDNCYTEGVIRTCEVVPRPNFLLDVRSDKVLNIDVHSIFDEQMNLFLIRGIEIVHLTGTQHLKLTEDLERIEPWLADEDFEVQLNVPGYLWVGEDGQWTTKLHTQMRRDDLIAQRLLVGALERDPLYWAFGSEGWTAVPSPRADLISELVAYLRSQWKTWSEYETKAGRIADIEITRGVEQVKARLQQLHLSAAASLLLARRSLSSKRAESFQRACERATDAWISMLDPEQGGEAANPEVHLDVGLLRIEACLCAKRMSPAQVGLAVDALVPLANKQSRSEYREVLFRLQNVRTPEQVTAFCGGSPPPLPSPSAPPPRPRPSKGMPPVFAPGRCAPDQAR